MRLGVFVLALLLVWVPLAAPIYWLVSDRNLVSILTMVLLYGEFLVLVQFWGKKVYRQPHPLRSYGLQGTRRNAKELLTGLVLGVAITLGLFGLEGWLGWLVWNRTPVYLPRVIIEGLASALGIGLAEEFLNVHAPVRRNINLVFPNGLFQHDQCFFFFSCLQE